MEVVYLPHRIDEASHPMTPVFTACEQAIQEIKTLIRIIVTSAADDRDCRSRLPVHLRALQEDSKVSSDLGKL